MPSLISQPELLSFPIKKGGDSIANVRRRLTIAAVAVSRKAVVLLHEHYADIRCHANTAVGQYGQFALFLGDRHLGQSIRKMCAERKNVKGPAFGLLKRTET